MNYKHSITLLIALIVFGGLLYAGRLNPYIDYNTETIQNAITDKTQDAQKVRIIASSPIYVTDGSYQDKISSGTAGHITATTSQTIVVAQEVISWSFVYRNLVNTETSATVRPSFYGGSVPLYNGNSIEGSLAVPATCHFVVTLPVEATMQYIIDTIND